jgi:probable rRNA maturation factor
MVMPETYDTPGGVVLHGEELVPELPDLEEINRWMRQISEQEGRLIGCLYFVFLNDADLLKINQDYLEHDTFTDIITFPYSRDPVEAEIYISEERVRANADQFGVSVREELLRVMAHGVLHVCGWDDKTAKDMGMMRQRENACLELIGVHQPISFPSS